MLKPLPRLVEAIPVKMSEAGKKSNHFESVLIFPFDGNGSADLFFLSCPLFLSQLWLSVGSFLPSLNSSIKSAKTP